MELLLVRHALPDRVDNTPTGEVADPALYARVARTFPDAIIEDPRLNPETRAALGESLGEALLEPRWGRRRRKRATHATRR
jgi:hypothetical protein